MRTFHIFNIKPYIYNLTKDDSYMLFHSLSKIKNLSKNDLSLGINIYEQIADPFNKDKINGEVNKYYNESDFHTVFKNKHTYINKYRSEESYLSISNAYIILRSNISNPDFLKYLKKKHHLFICDFENKDYFFANEI